MKYVSALLFLLFTQSFAQKQIEDQRTLGTFGVSAGTGLGVDFGIGKKTQFTDGTSLGWEFFLSVWTPDPSGGSPKGEEGYFDWLTPTDMTEKTTAWAIGGRYHMNQFRFGCMVDFIKRTTWQNYHSSTTGWDWHTAGKDERTASITGNIGYLISPNIEANIFAGPDRGFMIGLAFHGEMIMGL